jgi:hypothetical protein
MLWQNILSWCTGTSRKLFNAILGAPEDRQSENEEENAVAEDAEKVLQTDLHTGVQIMHEHLVRSGSQPGGGNALTSCSGMDVVNPGSTEEIRKSLLVDLPQGASADGSRRGSSAHPPLDSEAPSRRSSAAASQRVRGQSIRSDMRGNPAQGMWLVEIDSQVRTLATSLCADQRRQTQTGPVASCVNVSLCCI